MRHSWLGRAGYDCVGCHDGLITDCSFTGKADFTATAAVQLKGGTTTVIVEKCRFRNAGERPLNIGGSTALSTSDLGTLSTKRAASWSEITR